MKHYIIDGNNVIHKISSLVRLVQKDKQAPREKLVFMIERFFQDRKTKVTLHYDGFENLPIKTSFLKIIYSNKKEADEKIRQQIEDADNAKNIIVVTSDDAIKAFARKCRCEVISSEDFINQIKTMGQVDEETARINPMKNFDYWNDIFNADKS